MDVKGSSDDFKIVSDLHEYAVKFLGKEKADSILDASDDPNEVADFLISAVESYPAEKARNVVAEPIYSETPEGKYLQPIYDVADPLLKAAGLVEKAFVNVPVAAGRTVGKVANSLINKINPEYGEPISSYEDIPLYEELTNFGPTPAGSLTADLRENYPQEGFLKNTIPEDIKRSFPKATSAIEGFNPYDVADIATGISMAPAIKGGAMGSKIASEAKNLERIKTALIRSSDNSKYIHDLNASGKLDYVVRLISEDEKLLKLLDNPKKLQDKLSGIKVSRRDPVTGASQVNTSVPGLLEKSANDIKAEISKHSGLGGPDIEEIQANIVKRISDRVDEIGSALNEKQFTVDAILNEVDTFLKPNKLPESDNVLDFMMSKKRTPEQLVDIKRGASDRIFQAEQVPSLGDDVSLKKIVAEEIWKEMDNQINKVGEITGDYGIIKANNRYSDLATLRDIYGKKGTSQYKVPKMLENLAAGALIGGTAMSMGTSPWQSMILGGIPTAVRAAEGGLAYSSPSYAARAGKIAQKGYGLMSKIPTVPLALSLASYEIPRKTDQIMKERDLVLSKLAQETKTPEGQVLFDTIHDAMMNAPHKVAGLMKMMSDQYPQIFAQDKYQSFDGIIPPQNQKAALKDINNSSNYSNVQKSEKIKKLITEGYYDQL